MRSFVLLVLISVGMSCPSQTSASLVFSDNFNRANGALVGTTPTLGGNWVQESAGTPALNISSNQVPMASSGQDARAPFSTSVLHADNGAIYYGLDINLSAAQSTGDYFLTLGTSGITAGRLFAKSTTGGFLLGIAGTTGAVSYGTSVLNLASTYQVAIAWSFVPGANNDTFEVYVNPTSNVQASNTLYVSGTGWNSNEPNNTANIDRVVLRQGGSTIAPTLTVDNLIVATTFAEVANVAAVPEPTAFLFGGLVAGVIGLAAGAKKLVCKSHKQDTA